MRNTRNIPTHKPYAASTPEPSDKATAQINMMDEIKPTLSTRSPFETSLLSRTRDEADVNKWRMYPDRYEEPNQVIWMLAPRPVFCL